MDGSTCFHADLQNLERTQISNAPVAGFVKGLNPSEDGEALFEAAFRISPTSGFIPPELTRTSPEAKAPGWFAVYTTCRHEKRVAQHLSQREIEFYLPLYVAHRKWRDGSRVALELPLFPCYLFVKIARPERVKVLSVPGALTLVGGTGGEPALLPDASIAALRQGIQEGKIEPHPLLTAGQRVRIRSGAFMGMTGIVARRKNSLRVVLTLEQIMQSIAIELDESDVEPMPALAARRVAA